MTNQLTVKELFGDRSVQDRFEKLLGLKAQGFITSVLQTVGSNKSLKGVDPQTVLTAAATAASLDLPIDPNLGFAWIVPYRGKAQFQMGWKGFVQLALRTGQYQRINAVKVYQNQFEHFNRLTEELKADFSIEGEGEVVGYAAYYRLTNGMEKLCYWSKKEVENHAKKYSQAYKSSSSPWNDKDQFHAMAMKTVLKNMISKWGIMSIEMQRAKIADQSVQETEGQYHYIDNQPIDIEAQNEAEEKKRIGLFIEKAKSIKELEELESVASGELFDRLQERKTELKSA